MFLKSSRFLVSVLLFLSIVLRAAANDSPGEVDRKKFRFTPLAGPGYTPEMGFVLGGGFLMSWYPGDDPESVTRSTLPVMFTVATVGGYSLSMKPQTFWLEDRLRVDLEFRLRDMNDNYWGVGYDNGRNLEKGPDTTEYRQFWWLVRPTVRWAFLPDFYAGVLWDVGRMSADDVNPTMETDPVFLETGDDNFHSGPGFSIQYDTRDIPQNAWSGLLLEAEGTFFFEAMGSENTYQNLKLDYRQYQTLWRSGAVLAWQAVIESSWGDIPWSSYPQIGSPSDLRGYYRGRFRDATVLWGMVEYRHTFTKRLSDELSKFGFVAWAGLGALGPGLFSLEGVLPNVGAGLRYEVQPRMNVRFDIGWGLGSFGIYFNFQEAF